MLVLFLIGLQVLTIVIESVVLCYLCDAMEYFMVLTLQLAVADDLQPCLCDGQRRMPSPNTLTLSRMLAM